MTSVSSSTATPAAMIAQDSTDEAVEPAATREDERVNASNDSERNSESPTANDDNHNNNEKVSPSLLDEEDDDEEEDTKETFVVVDEEPEPQGSSLDPEKLRLMEEMHIGTATEILFPENQNNAWDNLRWMSLSGHRQVAFSRVVFRRVKEQFMVMGLFKSKINYTFPSRLLVLYQFPQLLLVLRRAVDLRELSQYTAVDFSEDPNNNIDTILQHYWIAESVVELATCKLQLSALTTHEISLIFGNIHHEREPSAFWIQTPNSKEQIFLSAVQLRPKIKGRQQDKASLTDSGAFLETTSTEQSIVHAIWQAHGMEHNADHSNEADEDFMWKHQVVLGTLHSLVLSGNVKALEEALDRAWKNVNKSTNPEDNTVPLVAGVQQILPSRIIDATDDNGRPALYYACKQGMNDAMTLLLRYGAKLDYIARNGDSLLHISARHLSDTAVNNLLTAASAATLEVNATNGQGHTPLYTAIIYGLRTGGRYDSLALERCIQAFKAYGGSLFGSFVSTQQKHPLLALALQYRLKDLAVLVDFLDLDFPLTGNMDVSTLNGGSAVVVIEESLAALHGYPLHRLLANFRNQIKCGTSAFDKENIVGTVKLLLQCGFEVNERLELAATRDETEEDLAPWVGFAPIQILALSAIELEKVGPDMDESVYGALDDIVSQLCEELVRNGARLSLEPPPLERKRQKPASPQKHASSNVSVANDESATVSDSDRSNLKLENSEHLLHLLGGRERLKKAQTAFAELGGVMVDPTKALRRDDNSTIADSKAAGGNNERSCAICWKQFGTLMNRKHRCRISWRHICDDCSSKRILVHGKDYRVSDGQFVRARALIEQNAGYAAWKKNNAPTAPKIRAGQPSSAKNSTSGLGSAVGSSSNMARVRQQRLEAEENANRDSLFGGDVMQQATDFLFGTDEQQEDKRSSQHSLNGLMNSLGETRNALLERGDKLSSLNEKSEKMVTQSEDFAKMATELRKQSERGLFW